MSEKTLRGISKTLSDLSRFGKEAETEVHIVTGATAKDIERDAKELAPVDTGKLVQSIKSMEVNSTTYKVEVFSPYGAYMEFGTGKSVEVPQELLEMALRFKGEGEREVNITPQPYLYPAFVKGRETYLKDLNTLLINLTKKYD